MGCGSRRFGRPQRACAGTAGRWIAYPPKTAHDNAHLIHLDTLLAAFLPTLVAMMGWALRGWADRLRAASHPVHVANSWAKHRGDFGAWEGHALALTVAHLVDRGLSVEGASALLRERTEARERKAAAA